MAQAAPEQWFILDRRVHAVGVPQGQHGASVFDDPNLLDLKLPVDRPPPHITRFTALTRIVHGQLSIVATSNKDLLLHELARPSEPNTPNIFFLAHDFMPDERAAVAAAGGRSVFDVTATRLLNRTPGLPHFSDIRNVGFLSLGGGTYVVAELQAANRQADNLVPFITLRSRRNQDGDDDDTVEWEWHQTLLLWPAVDDEANPQWTTHDVIAHDKKLWWVNFSRGLVACDPAPVEDLLPTLHFVALPVLDGFEDRQEPAALDRYRTVGVSAGAMRFVDVAHRRNDPEEETRVVVWTLNLPAAIIDARWEDNPRQTTLRNIRNSASYVPMPRNGVPGVVLVHPNQPAVVYFSLGQYVFSVDVNQSAVVHRTVDQQDGVPRPINQRGVLAWKRPHFKLRTVAAVYAKKRKRNQPRMGQDPAEG